MTTFLKTKVVCFGGGTGLPSLLSGLKGNPWLEITAIVNMFDTGGSSGELRDKFGILPPGDILKCLLALSKNESAAREMLLKRIKNQKRPRHTGGNILLMGLEQVYGSYLEAIDALGQLLSVCGSVVPVTLERSTLCAAYTNGQSARGETSVDLGVHEGLKVDKLFLYPTIEASPQAIAAIEQADLLCVGPGSFYTSVLSNFLPSGIQESIMTSKAPIIFIANLVTEGDGMRDLTLPDIVATVEHYVGRHIHAVLVNGSLPSEAVLATYADERKLPILGEEEIGEFHYQTIRADLWTHTIARHDTQRLAGLVSGLAFTFSC